MKCRFEMLKLSPRTTKRTSIGRGLHKMYRGLLENPLRQRLRKKILDLESHRPAMTASSENSLHCLLCARDVEMFICSQRSLYSVSELGHYRLFIHDDGTLTDHDIVYLERKLPNAKVLRRETADERAERELVSYPRILEYRRNQVMALKLVDVQLWATGLRAAYIDSDILFFSEPSELIAALSEEGWGNMFNRDIDDCYVDTRRNIFQAMGVSPASKVNAGLWVADVDIINLDTVEKWLAEPVLRKRPYYYTLEQTLISMLAHKSSKGVSYFSKEYDVSYGKSVDGNCVKHYVGKIRHGFELEGLRFLLKRRRFRENWPWRKV